MNRNNTLLAAIVTGLSATTCALALSEPTLGPSAAAQECGSDLFSQAGCLLNSVGGSGNQNKESARPSPQPKKDKEGFGASSLTDLIPKGVTDYIKVSPPKALEPQQAPDGKANSRNPGLPAPGPSEPSGSKISDYVPGLMLNTPGFDLGIGKDNRIPMVNKNYPWNTIGRVEDASGSHCTGTLIRRDIVITNAHCTGTNESYAPKYQCLAPDQIPQLTFKLNYNDGESIDVIRVDKSARGITRGTNCPGKERNQDWAILKLERPVNNGDRWMQIRVESPERLNRRQVINVGYSTFKNDPRPLVFKDGNVAGVDDQCSLYNFWPKQGIIGHNCDNGRGGSGGPLFEWLNNQATLLAVNAAEHRNGKEESFWIDDVNFNASTANVAVPLISFEDALKTYLELSDKSQYVVHKAQSGIGGPWGDWGKPTFCKPGTQATGYSQDVQSSQGRGRDDWSMSNFILLCSGADGKSAGIAGSHPYAAQFRPASGTFCPADTCKNPGDHRKGYSQPASKKCPPGEWITAFALKVESNQGRGDNTSGNSAKIRCSGGQELEASNAVHWGDSRWGPWQTSPYPNSYVCGARSKVVRQGQKDETALNDIELYWCQ